MIVVLFPLILLLFPFEIQTRYEDQLCVIRDKNFPKKCKKCTFSYIESDECFFPYKVIKDCIEYDTDSNCMSCRPGYTLSTNNDNNEIKTKCVPCKVDNCAICDSQQENQNVSFNNNLSKKLNHIC